MAVSRFDLVAFNLLIPLALHLKVISLDSNVSGADNDLRDIHISILSPSLLCSSLYNTKNRLWDLLVITGNHSEW